MNASKRGVIPNTRQDDGTGAPKMPKPRWDSDGNPCFKHLEENYTEDPIEEVSDYLVDEYGEIEGIEKLRRMNGLQVLALAKKIRGNKQAESDNEHGVPKMPKPRWTKDGNPDLSQLD